jgi:hypothetical protein
MATPAATPALFHRARFSFRPRKAAHPKRNGKSVPSAGFVIKASPHNSPYAHQSPIRSDSPNSSVAHKSAAARNAASDVSQIHSNGKRIAFGKTAQSQAAPLATPNPPILLPAKKIGTQAAEEKNMFSPTQVKKARSVKIPQILKVAATKAG